MLEASLYVSQNLPEGGLWAVVHCATWVALGELEWIPFAVLRKSIDVNLLGESLFSDLNFEKSFCSFAVNTCSKYTSVRSTQVKIM